MREAEIFVAVLGASNLTYAEATLRASAPWGHFYFAGKRTFQLGCNITGLPLPSPARPAVAPVAEPADAHAPLIPDASLSASPDGSGVGCCWPRLFHMAVKIRGRIDARPKNYRRLPPYRMTHGVSRERRAGFMASPHPICGYFFGRPS
jgi:hypothetical protein